MITTNRQIQHIFLLVLLLAINTGVNGQQEQIPLLILIETPAKLSVDYRSESRLARNLIFLNSFLGAAIEIATTSSNSKKLQEIIGEQDRTPIVENGFNEGFSTQPYFKISTGGSDNQYGNADDPSFNTIQADGFSHVLTVREIRAGLITAYDLSTLSAISSLAYKLIDAASGKVMVKDAISGFCVNKYTFQDAMTDRDIFLQDYPRAVSGAIGRIIGDLRKNGYLTMIAQQYGLGDKVPDTGAVLDQYEKRFSYDFKDPRKWEPIKMNTKYVTVLAPKEDKASYGLNITFDLLLDIFGQNVDTTEEYARIFLKRASASGFEPVPDRFPEFNTDEKYTVYTVEQKDTGFINVLLFKKLDDNFVVIYSVVMTQDYDDLYNKYKTDIESIINTAKIKTK